MAASRARKDASRSNARPASSSTWTTSPALSTARTPISHATNRARAVLKSSSPPTQPPARETNGWLRVGGRKRGPEGNRREMARTASGNSEKGPLRMSASGAPMGSGTPRTLRNWERPPVGSPMTKPAKIVSSWSRNDQRMAARPSNYLQRRSRCTLRVPNSNPVYATPRHTRSTGRDGSDPFKSSACSGDQRY